MAALFKYNQASEECELIFDLVSSEQDEPMTVESGKAVASLPAHSQVLRLSGETLEREEAEFTFFLRATSLDGT